MDRRQSLASRGFVLEADFLAPGELQALGDELGVLVRALLTHRRAPCEVASGDAVQDLAANLARLLRLDPFAAERLGPISERAPALLRFATDPSLVALAREVLAETIGIEGQRRMLVFQPGDDEPRGWDAAREAAGGAGSVMGLLALQDATPEGGALRLVPGQHRAGRSAYPARLGDAGHLFALQPGLHSAVCDAPSPWASIGSALGRRSLDASSGTAAADDAGDIDDIGAALAHGSERWDAAAGDLLLLDPRLPLAFEPNRSERPLFWITLAFRDLAATATRHWSSSAPLTARQVANGR